MSLIVLFLQLLTTSGTPWRSKALAISSDFFASATEAATSFGFSFFPLVEGSFFFSSSSSLSSSSSPSSAAAALALSGSFFLGLALAVGLADSSSSSLSTSIWFSASALLSLLSFSSSFCLLSGFLPSSSLPPVFFSSDVAEALRLRDLDLDFPCFSEPLDRRLESLSLSLSLPPPRRADLPLRLRRRRSPRPRSRSLSRSLLASRRPPRRPPGGEQRPGQGSGPRSW
mmetsp:Transcript_46635/g.84156  ORF Transcript_46635/g.84156 Transcript_46635/m.84156 type:complete len:228 (-) Transcript_46635:1216-1899(-)